MYNIQETLNYIKQERLSLIFGNWWNSKKELKNGKASYTFILCAWGNSINKRKYLKDCLASIYELISKEASVKYFHLNNLTKRGNPRHLLYNPINGKIKIFAIKTYIKMLTQWR